MEDAVMSLHTTNDNIKDLSEQSKKRETEYKYLQKDL